MKRRRFDFKNKTLLVLLVVIFGAIGLKLLSSSHAATTSSTPSQVTFRQSCATAPIGFASCFSLVRTDESAVKSHPLKPLASTGINQPQVAPGTCTVGSSTLGNCGAYDPAAIQAAYNLTSSSASNGQGRTIAVVDANDDPTAEADLNAYRSQFNLSPCTSAQGCFHKVNQNGVAANYPVPDVGWQEEIALDLDMVSATCPNCSIVLVEANSGSNSDLAAAETAAYKYGAVAISNSWGAPEGPSGHLGYTTAQSAVFNRLGVGITAGSGDSGYGIENRWSPATDGLAWPAVLPSVTAVGGTSLYQIEGSTTRNGSESVWGQAGSGCSLTQVKPSWQKDTGCPDKIIADVSAVADVSTPVWVYVNGNWQQFGGTSASSPIIASVIGLGSPAYSYLPSTPYSHIANFNDITTGSNGTCNANYLCNGTAGYDGPTGIGTPNGLAGFESNPTKDVPKITITTPSSGTNIVSGSFSVAGTASDQASSVSSVAMSIDGGTYATLNGTTSWTTAINASALSIGLHRVQIKATNATGNTALQSIGLLTGNVQAPTAPSNLTATAISPRQVNLSWTASTDVSGTLAGYDIYNNGELIASKVTTTTYTDLSVVPNTYYNYTVSAIDSHGLLSASTSNVNILTPKAIGAAPSTPVLTLKGSTYNSISMSWTASQSTVGINSYDINSSCNRIQSFVVLPPATSFIDFTVVPGQTCSYSVLAYDYDFTASATSNQITATTPSAPPSTPITAPSGLKVIATNYNQVELSWGVSTGGSGGVKNYSIYRNGILLKTIGPTFLDNIVNYVDGTTIANTKYTYYVVGIDTAGNKAQSASLTITTPPQGNPLSTLKGVVKSAGTSGVALSGVAIRVRASTGMVFTASTNSSGQYLIAGIPTGVCSVTFTKTGYQSKTASVTLPLSTPITLNESLTKL